MASKYDALGDYLAGLESDETRMSFAEVERVIGCPLPPKAANQPAWWSNNPFNNPMTKVWLNAGFRSERVDIAGRRLVFRRKGPAPIAAAVEEEAPAFEPAPVRGPPQEDFLKRVADAMKGTVKVAPNVDLTEPTGEIWDAEEA